ncbi:MAG: zinc ribbon domain-containing protein [Elusimicrobia bacterium]|nr:zinc ribbon domain-containing protein [Elusimicrobiota bacterium]
MKKQEFVCKNCGRKFVKEIFEKGEAEEKGLRVSLVTCPYCGSRNVEKI